MKYDIQKDNLYGKILNSDSTNLWKLKYIKYVFIKYPPPVKGNNDELYIYFQRYLKLEEDAIRQIIENLEHFLSFQDKILRSNAKN